VLRPALRSLQRLARVRAAAEGREFVTPDDVKALAAPTLAHRMALRPEAQMRGTAHRRRPGIGPQQPDGPGQQSHGHLTMLTDRGWAGARSGGGARRSCGSRSARSNCWPRRWSWGGLVAALLVTRFSRPTVDVVRQLSPNLVHEGDRASVDAVISNRDAATHQRHLRRRGRRTRPGGLRSGCHTAGHRPATPSTRSSAGPAGCTRSVRSPPPSPIPCDWPARPVSSRPSTGSSCTRSRGSGRLPHDPRARSGHAGVAAGVLPTRRRGLLHAAGIRRRRRSAPGALAIVGEDATN
jgi:hypothetical protein